MDHFAKNHDFLSDSSIIQANEILQLEQPVIEAYLSAAALIRNHQELRELIINCRDGVINADWDDENLIRKGLSERLRGHKQQIKEAMGKRSGMFAALIILLCLPRTVEYYHSKGMPKKILIDTMSDLHLWMRHYFDEHGDWGLGNWGWILNHVCGRLFQIGRLQYMSVSYKGSALVFRHIHHNTVIALSETGIHYREDGRMDGTNEIYAKEKKWTAQFKETKNEYTGYPITPDGLAQNEMIQLNKEDWQMILQKGDTVLEIHIGEGSKMTQCEESFYEAADFYKTYLPEVVFQALVCASWLMDSQFQTILPETSNIVKFQRAFYLLPIKSDEGETLQRVFGSRKIADPSVAPRNTSLRRAILDYTAEGNHLHGGAGFILKDDLHSGMKKYTKKTVGFRLNEKGN